MIVRSINRYTLISRVCGIGHCSFIPFTSFCCRFIWFRCFLTIDVSHEYSNRRTFNWRIYLLCLESQFCARLSQRHPIKEKEKRLFKFPCLKKWLVDLIFVFMFREKKKAYIYIFFRDIFSPKNLDRLPIFSISFTKT